MLSRRERLSRDRIEGEEMVMLEYGCLLQLWEPLGRLTTSFSKRHCLIHAANILDIASQKPEITKNQEIKLAKLAAPINQNRVSLQKERDQLQTVNIHISKSHL